jgi:outer membrane receptor for ferric coprogen and ferric-rhodotorulic acid
MNRDDVAQQVGTAPGFNMPGRNCCYEALGEFRSQGAEIEVAGEILPGWLLSGGFTFDDNTTEYGSAEGERLVTFAPRRQLKLWTRYQLPWGNGRFAVGGGVRAQSDAYRAGTANTWNPTGGPLGTGAWDGPSVPYQFRAPGRAVWDLFASWQVSQAVQLQFNFNNVLDKKYWQRVGNPTTGNTWGEPLNGLLTLRVEL